MARASADAVRLHTGHQPRHDGEAARLQDLMHLPGRTKYAIKHFPYNGNDDAQPEPNEDRAPSTENVFGPLLALAGSPG